MQEFVFPHAQFQQKRVTVQQVLAEEIVFLGL
jgi:hypothetical protein